MITKLIIATANYYQLIILAIIIKIVINLMIIKFIKCQIIPIICFIALDFTIAIPLSINNAIADRFIININQIDLVTYKIMYFIPIIMIVSINIFIFFVDYCNNFISFNRYYCYQN